MSSKEQENIQPEEELQQETIVNESNEEATNEEVVNEENQPSELELLQEELETQKGNRCSLHRTRLCCCG